MLYSRRSSSDDMRDRTWQSDSWYARQGLSMMVPGLDNSDFASDRSVLFKLS